MRSDLLSDLRTQKEFRALVDEKTMEDRLQKHKEIMEGYEEDRIHLEEKSANLFRSESGTFMQTNEIVSFSGHHKTHLPESSASDVVIDIKEVLSRPVLIDDFTYALGTNVFRSFSPWVNWSSNQAVRSYLRAFAYFRCTMCVRFVVASSKFHFGTLMMSYQPYPLTNPIVDSYGKACADDISNLAAFNNYLSQSPEKCVIRFGTDTIVELRLPLIIPKEALKIAGDSGVTMTTATLLDEFRPLGELFMTTINQLQIGSDDVNVPGRIQTYAWAEDVKVYGNTTVDLQVISESGPMSVPHPTLKANNSANDEYSPSNGAPSYMASAVVKVADALSEVPIIGRFAKATSGIANGLRDVFRMFGHSKPVAITPPVISQVVATDNLANCSGFSTASKITIDPKQELSIEPFGGATDVDELTIKYIAARESYLTTVSWTPANPPRLANIAMCAVYPNHNTGGELNRFIQPTALSWASHYFGHWRGTISFRFEVIASVNHRGKLMFVYEPNGSFANIIFSKSVNFFRQRIYYLDIEESKDITIHCPYMADRPFLNTRLEAGMAEGSTGYELSLIGNQVNGTNIRNLSLDKTIGGYLYVRPLTNLAGPVNAPNVQINVYVYSNDIELARPLNLDIPSRVLSESGISTSNSGTTSTSEPRMTESKGAKQVESDGIGRTSEHENTITDSGNSNDGIYLYNFGERVTSFRTLLKRSTLSLHGAFTATGTPRYILFNIPLYPVPMRQGVPVFTSTTNMAALTFQQGNVHTLFSELRYGFLFMKGGYRHKILLEDDIAETRDVHYSVTIRNNGGVQAHLHEFNTTLAGDVGFEPGNSGGTIFTARVNELVDVEVPYYSINYFELAPLSYATITDDNRGIFRKLRDSLVVKWGRLNNAANSIAGRNPERTFKVYSSAAEDFTFFRFQGGVPVRL